MNKIDEIIHGMQIANRPSNYWNDVTFPELEYARSVIQQDDKSVYDHTMSVIDLLSVKNSITLLAGLFHDLGKIYTIQTTDSSQSKFLGHEISSTRIATRRLYEWGASKYLIDRVCRLVMTHMCDIVSITNDKSIRKFIANVGQDNIENWFIVRKADSASYSKYGQHKAYIINPFYLAVMQCRIKSFNMENKPLKLQLKPNIIIGGKQSTNGNASLSVEGD